jgi:hypothetical protein
MALIRRLDHVIVAVNDRQTWIPVINRVLGLTEGRMLEGAGDGASSFSNAEFAIGDGFLGVVEPSGETSQLRRFLGRAGDGFYGMSIDVGDVQEATSAFEAHHVDYRGQAGQGLVWAGPRTTHGVLFQVINGMLLGPGANPRYRGLARLTVAVRDLEQAGRDYEGVFNFAGHEEIMDDPPGSRGMVLSLDDSPLGQHIVLATPVDYASPLAQRLERQGEGIFSFGIAVSDFEGELDRLRALDVDVRVEEKSSPARALIDPEALRGLRVELVDV